MFVWELTMFNQGDFGCCENMKCVAPPKNLWNKTVHIWQLAMVNCGGWDVEKQHVLDQG